MNYDLNQDDIDLLLKERKLDYSLINDYIFEVMGYRVGKNPAISKKINKNTMTHRCYCQQGRKEIQTGYTCKYCSRYFRDVNRLATPEAERKGEAEIERLKTEMDNKIYIYDNFKSTTEIQPFYYVKTHPEEPNGMLIYYVTPDYEFDEQENDYIDLKYSYVTEVVPGKKIAAYKRNKKSLGKCDLRKALNINSRTKNCPFDIVYYKSPNLIEFMMDNPLFARDTGLLKSYGEMTGVSTVNGFFLIYMYVYGTYPIIEMIVKMDYVKLLREIMKKIYSAGSIDGIRDVMLKLTDLINPEAKTGSQAFRFPKYIADYLSECSSTYKTYIDMADVYQLEGNMSKENFEKLTQNFRFLKMMHTRSETFLPNLASLIKYGYSSLKLMNYIGKQLKYYDEHEQEEFRNYVSIMTDLEDYNRMCDLLQVEADKYPKNLSMAHQNMIKAYNRKKDMINDVSIAAVAKQYDKAVEKVNKDAPDGYFITMPSSSTDLIKEGQSMHNCVGSYISSVAEGRSLVFFIRKKEDPEKSFITAERRNGYLNQIFYKNNIRVESETLRGFARSFIEETNRIRKY